MAASEEGLAITLLGLNYPPEASGIAPYTAGLATGLVARGHEVRVITAFPHYPQWRVHDGYAGFGWTETIDGVDVARMRHYVPRVPTLLPRAVSEATFGARLLSVGWGHPEVVLCVSPALISSAIALGRARFTHSRPATGLVVQDLYSAGISETQAAVGRLAGMVRRLESWAMHEADGVAVIHDRFKTRIERDFAVDSSRIRVIRNWTHVPVVEPFDKDAFRESLGWRPEEVIVLHAGAMGEKQGLSNVVAAAQLAEARGNPVRFVLLGDGSQRAKLEALAVGCSQIDFLDPLPGDHYVRAMKSADVLLVNERPGLVEMAVPSKLTSYFSTGVPVLAATGTGSTAAHEVVASGAGIVVEPGVPVDLVGGALRLSEDRVAGRVIGARGPAYCESMLSEQASLDAFNAWVVELAAQRRCGSGRSR